MRGARFAWLEITGRCQLACQQCYADSGPNGTHGTMRVGDWLRVIDELAAYGVTMVQFIGGEPMLHPELPSLIEHALDRRLRVEVFSNLVYVPTALWGIFERPGVSLATSYYSDDAAEHATITGRPSYARTRANIVAAVRRGIPVRAGVIEVHRGQRSAAAGAELMAIGVQEVGTDRVRQVGRAVRGTQPDTSQLCGQCASGVIAISPDGAVWPCVFSRWMTIGNVLEAEVIDILTGTEAQRVLGELRAEFEGRNAAKRCGPEKQPCDPQCGPACGPACNPQCWPTGTGPCRPNGGCQPNHD